MDDDTLLAALDEEARRVLEVEPAALVEPVPWCGDWSVGDVIGHLSGVQRWATALARQPGETFRRRDMERPPRGPDVLGWYEAGVEPMLDAFATLDLDVVVHTWAGERPRGWWLRRLTHETAVHRWDVDAGARGADAVRELDADVAVDGIDELLENFVPLVADALRGQGATLHLHATDADGEWQLTFAPDGLEIERSHAKADAAVRGPASEILLLLWNRRSLDDTGAEVFGDEDVLAQWKSAVRI
jgi:uncharacterized protein (TIGR03083 family)